MASDYYTFDIFKSLAIILSVFLLYLWLPITTLLISSNLWPLFCLSFSYIGQRFEDIKSVAIRSHKYKRKTDKIMAKGLKISKV
jgi:hypothetical protein